VSAAKEPCALCGLDIEQETVLRTAGGVMRFCCEGCLGIYRLVNDVEAEEDAASAGPARPNARQAAQ
jgi:hypothetical protein